MQKSFLNKIIFSLGIFFAFSLVTNQAQAAVLLPGNISTCGELAVSGTYTLTTNITGATTTCFKVTSNSVIIDGANHTVTATGTVTAYAITATSTANGGSAFGTTTVQNITFVNFSNGIDTRGNNRNSEADQVPGGNGGNLVLINVTLGSVISSGGYGATGSSDEESSQNAGNGGLGGNINISNSTIGALISNGGQAGDPNGGGYGQNGLGGNLNISSSTIVSISNSEGQGTGYTYIYNSYLFNPITLNNSTVTGSINNGAGIIIVNNSAINDITKSTGTTTVATSTMSSFSGTGGIFNLLNSTTTGNVNNQSGTINISGESVNLSNRNYSGTTLSITYSTSTGSLITSSTTLSSLVHFIINEYDYGAYVGGVWPIFPNPFGVNPISSCLDFYFSGSYVLTQDITNVSGTCFRVMADNVTIDGGGYVVTATSGNASYAVTATSSDIYDTSYAKAYGTTTLQNITFNGFGGGINASGNNVVSVGLSGGNGGSIIISSSTLSSINANGGLSGTNNNSSFMQANGGNGGNIQINNSTTSVVSANGANGGNAQSSSYKGGLGGIGGSVLVLDSFTGAVSVVGGNGGNGGSSTRAKGYGGNGGSITSTRSITGSLSGNGGNRGTIGTTSGVALGGIGGTINISGNNVILDNLSISVDKGVSNGTGSSGIINGVLKINYTNSLSLLNLALGNLSGLWINNDNKGSYTTGNNLLVPGNITSCGTCIESGTYVFSQDISHSIVDPCFKIKSNNITIEGNGNNLISSGSGSNSYAVKVLDNGSTTFSTTTIKNLTFSGYSSSTGNYWNGGIIAESNVGNGGDVILDNVSGVGQFFSAGKYGGDNTNGGNFIIKNSVVFGNIITEGKTPRSTSLFGGPYTNGIEGGRGGNIIISTSTIYGLIQSIAGNGGDIMYASAPYRAGKGGSGGDISVNNSILHGLIQSSGNWGGNSSTGSEYWNDGLGGLGGDGGDVTIVDSSVWGTITVNGYKSGYGVVDNPPGSYDSGLYGGNGGNVSLENSIATSTITSNGGDSSRGTGGNAGTITLTYATSTVLTAKGGNSTECGDGGLGGTINVSNDSVYSSYDISGGNGSNSGCLSETKSSGYAGQRVVFTAPARTINTVTAATSAPRSTGAILRNLNPFGKTNLIPLPAINFFGPDGGIFNPKKVGSTIIPYPFKDFKLTSPFVLTPSPDFKINVSNFLFSPLPSTISAALKEASKLQNFIAAAGLNKEQDLAKIANNPLILNTSDEVPPGHFVIKSGEQNLKTYVTYDKSVGGLAELAKVSPNQSITISLIPLSLGNVVASYLDQQITFEKASDFAVAYITTPTEPGRYVLKTSSSPIPLLLEVVAPPKIEEPVVKPWGVFNFIWKLFNK